jgi:hypothetical protein
VDQKVIDALGSIEGSLDCIARNLPDTPGFYTGDLEAAILNGFQNLGPGIGGQWFDKSLENIDTSVEGVEDRLMQLNDHMEDATKWLHDINISLRLLVQLKAGEIGPKKPTDYWDQE